MVNLRLAMAVSIAAICIMAGCQKKTISDDHIATGIKANLFSDPTTKAANVNVSVNDGVVTLTGEVPSPDVELQAMKIAHAAAGVKRVNDQIKVNASLAANQPQPDNSQPPGASTPIPKAQPAPTLPPTTSAPASPPPAETPAAAPSPAPATARRTSPPRPVKATIPAGEHVTIRTIDSIDSDKNQPGQVFRASLVSPLVSRGRVVVPAGTTVTVMLANASDAGRIKGRSSLEIRLHRLEYKGRSYPLASSLYEEQGKSRGHQTAKRTGIGAVAGAVIGAIAGGGKGAAIGSAVGGGGAAGYQLFTHGQKVKIPSETIVTFRLVAPVTIDVNA